MSEQILDQPRPDVAKGIRRRIVQVFLLVAVQGAILFISAGDVRWINGWAYVGLSVIGLLVAAGVLIPRSPEMVASRSEIRKEAKGWDKWLGLLSLLFIFPGVLLVAGLDARWGWSQVPPAGQIAGGVAFMLGYALFVSAMLANVHFEMFVRIQDDRGHQVMTSGPYRFVRHPAYLGQIITLLGTPFLLNSLWALIGTAGALAVIVVRTALEDRTLRQELDGYQEFTTHTRYRLLPGIW